MTSENFYLQGIGLVYGDKDLGAFASECLNAAARRTVSVVPELGLLLPKLNLRRASLGARLALESAAQACFRGGLQLPLPPEAGQKTGLYIGSALGAVESSFLFMDSILEGGPQLASPTHFSHSVNNVFCGLLSAALNIQGPSCTVCQYGFSFAGALQAALAALAAGTVEFALVGGVEQKSSAMERVQAQAAPAGKFATPTQSCAVFFLISADRSANGQDTGLGSREDNLQGGHEAGGPSSRSSCRQLSVRVEPPFWSACRQESEGNNAAFPTRLARFYAGHPLEQALDLTAAALLLANPDSDSRPPVFPFATCRYSDARRALAVDIHLRAESELEQCS